MIFKNKKWIIFDFLPYEHKSLEEYLEKKALKGWMLESMNKNIMKFKKIALKI